MQTLCGCILSTMNTILVVVLLQAPSYHLIFEAVLILAIIRLFFVKSYKPERTVLTEKVSFYLCHFVLLLSLL